MPELLITRHRINKVLEPDLAERNRGVPRGRPLEALLTQARLDDAAHRAAHQKPISADTLRGRLRIGATSARRLAKIVRAGFKANVVLDAVGEET